jgi:flagellar assembly protein FliH
MNTLCELVAPEELAPPEQETIWEDRDKVRNFQYPRIASVDFPSARQADIVAREIRMERAQSAALEAARQSGVSQGQAQAQAEMTQQLDRERQAIGRAIEQFAHERRSYFRRVETDVVTLTLAIARKLLRREAQIDPLLLSGVVRVALEQVQAGSQVVLRTSPSQQGDWQRFLAELPETGRAVAIVADEAVAPGTLLLETSAGKAEINLEPRLKEIENGFLDLLRGEGQG